MVETQSDFTYLLAQGGTLDVRVIKDETGATWWVARDVCDCLDLSNSSRAIDRLDDDEKTMRPIKTPGGTQPVLVVNESGLYRLIFSSRTDAALSFKRWVFHDVLPSIRKTGSYSVPVSPTLSINKTLPSDPVLLEAFLADARANAFAAAALKGFNYGHNADALHTSASLLAGGDLDGSNIDVATTQRVIHKIKILGQYVRVLTYQDQHYPFALDLLNTIGLPPDLGHLSKHPSTRMITYLYQGKLSSVMIVHPHAALRLSDDIDRGSSDTSRRKSYIRTIDSPNSNFFYPKGVRAGLSVDDLGGIFSDA